MALVSAGAEYSNPAIQEVIERLDANAQDMKLGWFRGRAVTQAESGEAFPEALKSLKDEVARLGYVYDIDKPVLDNLTGWANACLSDRTVEPFSDTALDAYRRLTEVYNTMNEDMQAFLGLTDNERMLIAAKYPGLIPETLSAENAATAFYELKSVLETVNSMEDAESSPAAGQIAMGVGIDNGGGGCWFNAALKCLIHTVDFQALSAREDLHPKIKEVAFLLAQLKDENEAVKRGEKSAFFSSEIPAKIRGVLHEFCRDTSHNINQSLFPLPYNDQQRDAGELVIFLFDLFKLNDNSSMSLTNKKEASAEYQNKQLKKQLKSEPTAVPFIIVPKKESPEEIARKIIGRESGLRLPAELEVSNLPVDSDKRKNEQASDVPDVVEPKFNVMQPCSDEGDEGDDEMDDALMQASDKDTVATLLMKAGASEAQARKLADDECAKPVTMRDALAATLGEEVQRGVKWSPENLVSHGIPADEELALDTRLSSHWQVDSTALDKLFIMFNLFSHQNHASGKNAEETKEIFLDGGDPICLPAVDQDGNRCQVKGKPRSIICHTGGVHYGHYITLNMQDDGSVVVEDDTTVLKLEDYTEYGATEGIKGFIRNSGYSPYMVCYECEVVPADDVVNLPSS